MVPSELTRAFGTVALTTSELDSRRTRATLTISVPVESQQLRWAVLPGPCGANTLPLIGFEAYPLIDIGASGRGQVEAELPFALPTQGEYHVNIYSQGQQISDVLTCGNLKVEGSAD